MNETNDACDALPEFQFKIGEGLFWGGQLVANFEPQVKSLIKSISDGDTDIVIHFICEFADGSKSDMKTILLAEIETINWHDIDFRCQLNPDCAKASKYLNSVIRRRLPPDINNIEKEYVFYNHGMEMIEEYPAFCIGDTIIKSSDIDKCLKIRAKDVQGNLAINECYSERQAVEGVMRIVNLSPMTIFVILAHCLLNLMRSLYTDVCKTPTCILFLVGLTGTKKTTIASLMTQMYDRDKGIVSPFRLNSSSPAFEQILFEARDRVIVLDDLFPAKSSETRRKQEKTLNDLIRIIGDDSGRAIKKGDEVVAKAPRCGVMITSEYLVGMGSDAARLLPITFPSPIDNTLLTQCQNEPLIISSFYKFFIEWLIENFKTIRELLKKLFAESRRTNLGVHDRLEETHFCLTSAYNIFLQYCIEKKFTTLRNAQAQYMLFQNHLTNLVRQQDKRVNMIGEDESDQTDYLSIIHILYNANMFILAKNVRGLKEKHHGLIHDDHLCLRGSMLLPEVLKLAPSATLSAIIESLSSQGALKKGRDKNVIQITGGSGKRFLAIPLKKLRKLCS
jgi:molybdopterin converting factor small subunit